MSFDRVKAAYTDPASNKKFRMLCMVDLEVEVCIRTEIPQDPNKKEHDEWAGA